MINYKKTILLTGAGFSKNFGGYLAREIWSKIFNHPDLEKFPTIKEKLKSNFDFESIYSDVLKDSSLSLDEKNVFQRIIISAYVDMDDMLSQHNSTNNDPYQINFRGVSNFLGLFAGSNNEVGINFTLNHDLFLERKVTRPALGLGLLEYKNYSDVVQTGRLDSTVRVDLPDDTFIENFKQNHLNSSGDLFYIKLHGSLGWWSATGNKRMVLGNNKLADIMQEPLLKWYFEIFEEALFRDGVKLFILGYSFNDSHINEKIVKAVKNHGLKIYVISPTDPEVFKNRLIGKPTDNSTLWEPNKDGQDIWKAVANFFPYYLKEIFPSDQSETDKKRDLFNAVKNN